MLALAWVTGVLKLGKHSLANREAEVRCFYGPKVICVGKFCSIGKCTLMVDAKHNLNYASTSA